MPEVARDPARRSEVVDRFAAVLRYAEEAVAVLLESDFDPGDKKGFFTRVKIISETAILLYSAARCDLSDLLEDPILCLRRALARHARSDELLIWAQMRPNIISELTVAHLILNAMGDTDEVFEQHLATAARKSSVGALERLPWKDLERAWQSELGAHGIPFLARPEVERTALNMTLDAIFATREEIYAFTHALIYHTDFGHRQPPFPRPVHELLSDATSALVRCLDDDDFDLCAELLLTWPYTKRSWCDTAAFAMQVIYQIEDDIGILPSLSLKYDEYHELSNGRRRSYFFQETYHTVYVSGLLNAALVTSGFDHQPTLSRSPELSAYADELYRRHLPAKSRRPLWQTAYERLQPVQRGALAPFLAEVAVRRSIQNEDYDGLREVLSSFLRSGCALTPGIVQAVELTARLASVVRQKSRLQEPSLTVR